MTLSRCDICGEEVPSDLLEIHRQIDSLDLRERRRTTSRPGEGTEEREDRPGERAVA